LRLPEHHQISLDITAEPAMMVASIPTGGIAMNLRAPAGPVEQLEPRTLFGLGSTTLTGFVDSKTIHRIDIDGGGSLTRLVFANVQMSFDLSGTNIQEQQVGTVDKVTADGPVTFNSIDITSSGPSSFLSILPVDRTKLFNLPAMTCSSSMRAFIAPNALLTGPLTFGGGLQTLQLGAADEGTISIGSQTGWTSRIVLKDALDTNITSQQPIQLLFADSITDAAATPTHGITAPWISVLRTRFDLSTNLTLTGVGAPRGITLARQMSGGSVSGGTWSITGDAPYMGARSYAAPWSATVTGRMDDFAATQNVSGNLTTGSIDSFSAGGSMLNFNLTLNAPFQLPQLNDLKVFRLGGSMVDSTLNSTGSLGVLSAQSMFNSKILAGVNVPALNGTLPTSPTDFTVPARIGGLFLDTRAVPAFSNSLIVASNISRLVLGRIDTDNGGTPFGVGAAQGVGVLVGFAYSSTQNQYYTLTNLTSQTLVDDQISKKKLSFGDFKIAIQNTF
jgi:hypothetical protein